MRVAIVDSQVSFFHGGAELLAARLADAMRAHGHHVEQVRIPLNPAHPRDIERALDFSLGEDLDRWIAAPDVVVALRFPAYLVRHRDKRVWLLHQLRQYYEYYNGESDALRARIVEEDRSSLAGASRLWAMSSRIAERLERNNGVKSSPLLPPLPTEQGFYRGGQERYVFFPSRLEQHKRQWLLIEAMRHVASDVKAVIGGEGGAYTDYKELVARHGLEHKVLLTGRLAHEVQAAWYANALAVFFGPEDEDYGFITLEAMLSGKPVITCADSGGPLDFVAEGVTGHVVPPTPEAVAACIDSLASNPQRARSLGDAGYDRYLELGLTWDKTVAKLLA